MARESRSAHRGTARCPRRPAKSAAGTKFHIFSVIVVRECPGHPRRRLDHCPLPNRKSEIANRVSRLFPHIPAFSRIFPPFPAYFRIKKILRRWVLSLPSRRAHGLRIQKPPYSSLFQAIPGYSSLLRHRVEGGGLWSIARFKRNRKLLLPSHSQNLHNVKQNASLTGINRDKPALSGIKPKLFFSPKWRAVCFYFA